MPHHLLDVAVAARAYARRDLARWMVLAFCLTASVACLSGAVGVMVAPVGAEAPLVEAAVPVGAWSVTWSARMKPPSVEQEEQLDALRLAAAGTMALTGVLALLIAVELWRQRLQMRRGELAVHRAVGASALQHGARLVGEAWTWGFGVLAMGLAIALWLPALLRSSFPGQAHVAGAVGWSLLGLSGVAALFVVLEVGVARRSAQRAGRLWSLSSLTAIGALAGAVFTGVLLFVRHAPQTEVPSANRGEVAVGLSLSGLPVGARRQAIQALDEASAGGRESVGLASAGALRSTGMLDPVWVDCGNCIWGLMPLPVRTVPSEVFAVAQDTFSHLGLRIEEGRDFQRAEDMGELDVAIVSRALANRHFEKGEAVGRTLRIGDSKWLRVVGIVSDRPDRRTQLDYAVYVPATQAAPTEMELVGSRLEVDRVLAALPAGVVASPVRSIGDLFSMHRWFTKLLVIAATLAGALLAIGLWVVGRSEAEVLGYEVGLRKAVGATSGRLWRFAAGRLATQLGAAVVVGLWLSLFVAAGLHEAYGAIPSIDVGAWLIVATIVLVAGIVGTAPTYASAIRRSPAESLAAGE